MVVPKPNPTKDKLMKLIAQKDELETQISNYGAILATNGDVGMHGSLVDAEEFPRNDIDVHQVRQARQQIICLQNDHKELMKRIEQLMHILHAETAADGEQDLATNTAGMQLNTATSVAPSDAECSPLCPIVKVNLVSPGSPAEDAGLCIGDYIIEFGTVNSKNFNNNIQQIGTVVQHMQNQRIKLKVQRAAKMLDLILIPKLWNGRGLLGCNIVLPDTVDR